MPPKTTQPVEVNRFVKGLITEASPLNFPADAFKGGENFELFKDGTIGRRLGMDFEEGYVVNETNYLEGDLDALAVNTFLWENVGEEATQAFVVIQIGKDVYFHEAGNSAISSVTAGTITIGNSKTRNFSFAAIDGNLIVASGRRNITTVVYDKDEEEFTTTTFKLKARDQWGVEDRLAGKDLREGGNISLRPSALKATHLYNLRNQSWGLPRSIRVGEVRGGNPGDPLLSAKVAEDYDLWPSNADIMHEWVRPDPENKLQLLRFFTKDFRDNPPFNIEAPTGFFIIDALHRGASRTEVFQENQDKHPALVMTLDSTPGEILADTTPGGATVITEYAGRVFYAGFSGTVEGGDANSPRLSSYLMFSQLVDKTSDLEKCYQEGDPTSPDTSDLVATDGGVIRISGAGSIIALIAIDTSLFIVATNGLWRLSGGSDFGFAADNYEVSHITTHGPTGRSSLVRIENTLMYWSTDGIYSVQKNEVGNWSATNITQSTIQSYFDAIPPASKSSARGAYDIAERRVRWIYDRECPGKSSIMSELIFDLDLGAWIPFMLFEKETGTRPKLRDYAITRPTNIRTIVEQIVADGDDVTAGGVLLNADEFVVSVGVSALKYVVLYEDTSLKYTLSEYNDLNWLDWDTVVESEDGIDAEARMETGWVIAGDSSRDKMVPFLTWHMEKTRVVAEGFDEDCATGEITPQGYSCSAFEESIIALNPLGYWKMNDPSVDGQAGSAPLDATVHATVGTDLEPAGSGGTACNFPSLIDDCDGLAYRTRDPVGPDTRLDYVGTVGPGRAGFVVGVFLPSGGALAGGLICRNTYFSQETLGGNEGEISLALDTLGITVQWRHALGGSHSELFAQTEPGVPYYLMIDVQSSRMKVYVDFVLQGTIAMNDVSDYDAVGDGLHEFMANFTLPFQHMWVRGASLTAEELAALKIGFKRTFEDYTP